MDENRRGGGIKLVMSLTRLCPLLKHTGDRKTADSDIRTQRSQNAWHGLRNQPTPPQKRKRVTFQSLVCGILCQNSGLECSSAGRELAQHAQGHGLYPQHCIKQQQTDKTGQPCCNLKNWEAEAGGSEVQGQPKNKSLFQRVSSKSNKKCSEL